MNRAGDKITVLICVGPEESHTRWLDETLDSVVAQTVQPDEILVVNDASPLTYVDLLDIDGVAELGIPIRFHRNPCWLGNVASVNTGVWLAESEHIILLASDDTLHPKCVEECKKVLQRTDYVETYYWFCIRMFGLKDEKMCLASGPSMVSKSLWKLTGGVPPQAVVGHPDSILVGIMETLGVRMVNVGDGAMLYNARLHSESEYHKGLAGGWETIIGAVRQLCIDNHKPPVWVDRVLAN